MSALRSEFLDWWRDLRHLFGRNPTPQELVSEAVRKQFPREKMQVPKRQTAFTYVEGPMNYLGQQIVKAMEDAGYPAKILYCYRSPEIQRGLYAKGRTTGGRRVTNAKPWESPHQYYEAVDIIHPALAWRVSDKYWDTLAACVRIVAEKYGVNLKHGHDWDGDGIPVRDDPDEQFQDSAHIELADWRTVRDRHRNTVLASGQSRAPSREELWARFCEVLPKEAERLKRDGRLLR